MERWGKPNLAAVAVVAERGLALDDQTLARLRAPPSASASALLTVKLHAGKSPKNAVFQISPNSIKRKRSQSSSNGEQRVSLCAWDRMRLTRQPVEQPWVSMPKRAL